MARVVVMFTVLLLPAAVSAHIHLVSPTARTTAQKTGPCGTAGNEPGPVVAVFEAGQTVTVTFDETIDHPAHYRIALAVASDDELVDPASLDELYSNGAVLADGLADADGGRYAFEVALPEGVTCERCTLQLVQVMYDKAPPRCERCVYGDNDLYYQCADIAIVEPGEAPPVESMPEPPPEPPAPGHDADRDLEEQHDHEHDHEAAPADTNAEPPAGPTANSYSDPAASATERPLDSRSVGAVGCAASPVSLYGLFAFALFRRRRKRYSASRNHSMEVKCWRRQLEPPK